jgi:deazaflavin-dependent oxidoreductase (nitroreductase family)
LPGCPRPRTERTRRTVVGVHEDDTSLWVVAEQGRHAGYVRNIEAHPQVRVRLRGRWRKGIASIVDSDDPRARLKSFGRARHAALVERVGTQLLSVRIDLERA